MSIGRTIVEYQSQSTANPFLYLWFISSLIGSTYKLIWDLKMDYGFFDKNAGENKYGRLLVNFLKTKFKFNNQIHQNEIKLAYVNVRNMKVSGKLNCIEQIITVDNIKIVCLVETFYRLNSKFAKISNFSGYHIIRNVGEKRGGGISCFIHDSLEAYKMQVFGKAASEILWLKLLKCSPIINPIIVYFVAGNSILSRAWNKKIWTKLKELDSLIKSDAEEANIAGDFVKFFGNTYNSRPLW